MRLNKPLQLALPTLLAVILLSACNLAATPAPTVDAGAMQTQVFIEVMAQAAAQQTQTALAVPPTPLPTETPFPTLESPPTFAVLDGGISPATPTAGFGVIPTLGFTPLALPTATLLGGMIPTITTQNGCNDGTYIGEVGDVKKDGQVLAGGQWYQHAWTILNTGACTWDEGFSFNLVTQFSSPEIEWNRAIIPIEKAEEFTKPQHSQSFVVKFKAPKTPGNYEAYWKLQDESKQAFGPMVWIKFTVP